MENLIKFLEENIDTYEKLLAPTYFEIMEAHHTIIYFSINNCFDGYSNERYIESYIVLAQRETEPNRIGLKAGSIFVREAKKAKTEIELMFKLETRLAEIKKYLSDEIVS